MGGYRTSTRGTVFVGVDLHRSRWHVTVRTEDQQLFSDTLPGHWEALRSLLDMYRGDSIEVVYEAGYFGFWLPESTGRLWYRLYCHSTERARKLAHVLAKGM